MEGAEYVGFSWRRWELGMWVTPGSVPGVSVAWTGHCPLVWNHVQSSWLLWRCSCGSRAAAGSGAKPRLWWHQQLPREEPGAACPRAGAVQGADKALTFFRLVREEWGTEMTQDLLPRLKEKQNWSGTWASSVSAGNTLEASKWSGWCLEAGCSMLWLALRMICKSSKMWCFKNAPSLCMWDVEWWKGTKTTSPKCAD